MANPFAFATVNHIPLALGIPYVSLVQGDLVLVSVREHVASGESVVIQERRLAVGEAADVDAGEPRTL
jgi:hypothetical protein